MDKLNSYDDKWWSFVCKENCTECVTGCRQNDFWTYFFLIFNLLFWFLLLLCVISFSSVHPKQNFAFSTLHNNKFIFHLMYVCFASRNYNCYCIVANGIKSVKTWVFRYSLSAALKPKFVGNPFEIEWILRLNLQKWPVKYCYAACE